MQSVEMGVMKRKQITLRLPADLYEKLQQEAERKGMQLNEEVSIILYDYFFENVDLK